jgi:hypothetical protein
MASKQFAIDWARQFVGNGDGRVFFRIDANDFLNELEARINNPKKIFQADAAVCGPATFLYGLARHRPFGYAHFACWLFMRGSARLGNLNIVAPDNVKNTAALHGMGAADWVTLASLRLARNWVFTEPQNLNKVFFTGVTWPASLTWWLSKAGYNATNRANLTITKGWTNWQRACRRHNNGEIVCMFINTNMLSSSLAVRGTKSSTPNHWIGLANIISERKPVNVEVFTWGDLRTFTFTAAEERNFKRHYYGYVSAKP